MQQLTPTFISNKGWPTTHLDMESVEVVGLVKTDVLAQGGLAVMRDAVDALKAMAALEPGEDPEVWEMIARGEPERFTLLNLPPWYLCAR